MHRSKTPPKNHSFTQVISHFLVFSFYSTIILICICSFQPSKVPANPVLLQNLFNGSDAGYIIPGSDFAPLKSVLPKRGRFSLIMDNDFENDLDEQKALYDYQNYLAPLILNQNPDETYAIVNCSNEALASNRLGIFGYSWLINLGNGKGVALKKSR